MQDGVFTMCYFVRLKVTSMTHPPRVPKKAKGVVSAHCLTSAPLPR